MKPFTENDLRVLRERWSRPRPPGENPETAILVRRLLATIDALREKREERAP